MQRLIKFRAWVTDQGEPFMAVQGESDLETLQSFIYHWGDQDNLMQLTDWKDKNGVEIYEGDVLRVRLNGIKPGQWEYENMKVVWFHGVALGRFVVVDKRGDAWSGLSETAIEVIGNIHDNQELLKSEV